MRDLLLADLDELLEGLRQALDATRAITEQLHPERARSCGIAIAITAAAVDEIGLRAHTRPIDECGQ